MLNFQVDETTVDRLVEVALEHRMASVKLRYDLDPRSSRFCKVRLTGN